MPKIKRTYIVLFTLILVGGGVFIWIRSYLFDNIAIRLHERLSSLNVSGFNVHYDSIAVSWRSNVIEIHNLVLEKNAYDTTCVYPEFISVEKVTAEGVGLFQLILRNILVLDAVHLDKSRLVMREHSRLFLDSAATKENEFTLQIGKLFIRSAELTYTDSSRCEVITAVKTNIAVNDLDMDFHIDKPFTYAASQVRIDSTEIQAPRRFYACRILMATMDFRREVFRADSIRLIPDFAKLEFGKKHGYEVDRYEAVIPFVKAASLSLTDAGGVKAGLAEIQFYLKVFRDKRLPFPGIKKLLPQERLRDLPFDLLIDSLKVTKSYVEYEEYADGATEPAVVFFDNLYAMLLNINSASPSGDATLSAKADLLGHGDVVLYATFPLDPRKRTSVKGSIKNFSLPEINPLLTPATQIKVESGELKELLFNFTFNSIRSDGEIELNYENLKLITFKEEGKTNGEEPEKDNLKTFIMNTFIFRKNMHEDLPEEKRTGTIMYLRDDTRSIFNFWSKSLVSGIKSAYKLDKTEAKKTEREIKKENRLLRREARKSRRAARKKEHG